MTLPVLLTVLLSASSAAEPPPPLPRSAEGVAAGIGSLRGTLQECLAQSSSPGEHLVHLRFTVDTSGQVGEVESVQADPPEALTACLAAPFAELVFAEGEQEMPVEVPISIERTHTEREERRE